MRNSLEHWKRKPTTAETLFAIDLPYRPPKSAVGAFLWRRRFWLETTWGLSLLEPWEKILVCEYHSYLYKPARGIRRPVLTTARAQ